MDVLILLDKLDDLIYSSKAIPLTDQVRVEREAAYSLLDQIRLAMPEEIKRARSLVKEREEPRAPEPKAEPRPDDRRLREIASSIQELKRSQRPAPPPLTAAAAEKVRSVIEAAEASAAEVRAEAEREARRIEAEAARQGMEMRKRSAAEAAARLKRADEVTAALLAEAASASADIDGLLDRVRGPAAALADVFGDGAAKVEAHFVRMRARVDEAPLGDEWDSPADPAGEILARRQGAAEPKGATGAEGNEPAERRSDPVSQGTEEWSVEDAMSAADEPEESAIPASLTRPRSGVTARRIHAEPSAPDDAGAELSGARPQGRRFERAEGPQYVRP